MLNLALSTTLVDKSDSDCEKPEPANSRINLANKTQMHAGSVLMLLDEGAGFLSMLQDKSMEKDRSMFLQLWGDGALVQDRVSKGRSRQVNNPHFNLIAFTQADKLCAVLLLAHHVSAQCSLCLEGEASVHFEPQGKHHDIGMSIQFKSYQGFWNCKKVSMPAALHRCIHTHTHTYINTYIERFRFIPFFLYYTCAYTPHPHSQPPRAHRVHHARPRPPHTHEARATVAHNFPLRIMFSQVEERHGHRTQCHSGWTSMQIPSNPGCSTPQNKAGIFIQGNLQVFQ
jgi:hypothetical protein